MASSPSTLRQGDVLDRKYEIESVLGSGPAGSAYVARAMTSNKKVCIKLINGPRMDESSANALIERIRGVQHDGLAKVLDQGTWNDRLYLAQDLCEGESLRRLMDSYAGQRRFFSLLEACQITMKILEVAEAAHNRGIIHRHIKPANVVVQSRTVGPGQGRPMHQVRVTGLGFCEMVHPGVLREQMEQHLDRGDGRYIAPELSAPGSGGTAQADIYSVGVIFYELLCGQTPQGTYLSPSQIREDLPKHVDDIVDIALNANPEDRYPTARDMINDIQRAIQDDDKPAAPGLSRRHIGMVLMGAVLLMGGVAGWLALSDPEAKARQLDEELRAKVIKENVAPSAATVEEKIKAHPEMVWIAEGTFLSGRMNAEEKIASPTEPLVQAVKLPAFYMDRFEWENKKGGSPQVRVTWEQASQLCTSVGKRLCSAQEWERACKGLEMTNYTYGNTFTPETCGADVAIDADRNNQADYTSGSLENCKSSLGVFDLSGGPREWTATDAGSANQKVIKGGHRGLAERASRCAYSDAQRTDLGDSVTSFRCCMDDK